MANEKNLRKFSTMSKDELKEISRRGGVASGESKRKAADIRRAMNELMKMPAKGRAKEIAEDGGFVGDEQTNANAVAMKLFNMAIAGNSKAMEMLFDYFFKANEDERKTRESNARIDALKKNGVDISVNSSDGDDGGVVIYLPEIEKEEEKGEEE